MLQLFHKKDKAINMPSENLKKIYHAEAVMESGYFDYRNDRWPRNQDEWTESEAISPVQIEQSRVEAISTLCRSDKKPGSRGPKRDYVLDEESTKLLQLRRGLSTNSQEKKQQNHTRKQENQKITLGKQPFKECASASNFQGMRKKGKTIPLSLEPAPLAYSNSLLNKRTAALSSTSDTTKHDDQESTLASLPKR